MNDSPSGDDTTLHDSSGHARNFTIRLCTVFFSKSMTVPIKYAPLFFSTTPIGSGSITSISEVRTRTSDSLEEASFSDWEAVGTDGVIQSPNLRYIQIQMTLSTTDTSMTPELSAIQIYETPKAPYSKLGYARPVVLSDSGIRKTQLPHKCSLPSFRPHLYHP